MKITQTNEFIQSHKTGSLDHELTPKDISTVLGFTPETNLCEKVTQQWNFFIDGIPCSIWDYKGSKWSTFGPAEKLSAIFGEFYTDGAY